MSAETATGRPTAARVDESETVERLHVTRSRAKPGGVAAQSDGAVPFRRARKPPWLKCRRRAGRPTGG